MNGSPLWFFVGFAFGSIPFGWLLGRARGVDVRHLGSGNIGATNVGRTLGWLAGLFTLVGDATKGALPAFLAQSVGPAPWAPAFAACGAVCGHVFCPFLGFRGGKGVATAAGAMLILAPKPLLVSAASFAVVTYFTGYVSAGSLTGAALLPIFCWAWSLPNPTLLSACLCSGLVWLRHRDNLYRLANGTEPKLRLRRPPT
ncbi:MAG: glycerol-3-phosphate acyltransferase [Candidatus Binatia bacterium]|nr:MAG: glycerol-3-phosphate acyltransferase [Candidatus Binatia bacterium]